MGEFWLQEVLPGPAPAQILAQVCFVPERRIRPWKGVRLWRVPLQSLFPYQIESILFPALSLTHLPPPPSNFLHQIISSSRALYASICSKALVYPPVACTAGTPARQDWDVIEFEYRKLYEQRKMTKDQARDDLQDKY